MTATLTPAGVHKLAATLDAAIAADPDVKAAQARLTAALDRVEALDEALANELDVIVNLDVYCSAVRATIASMLETQR